MVKFDVDVNFHSKKQCWYGTGPEVQKLRRRVALRLQIEEAKQLSGPVHPVWPLLSYAPHQSVSPQLQVSGRRSHPFPPSHPCPASKTVFVLVVAVVYSVTPALGGRAPMLI